MRKGVDADQSYCTMIGHTLGISSSVVTVPHSLLIALLQHPWSDVFSMAVSLRIKLSFIVRSLSDLLYPFSVPAIEALEARLSALSLPWTQSCQYSKPKYNTTHHAIMAKKWHDKMKTYTFM